MYEHIHLSLLRQKINKIDTHSSTTFTVPKGVKKIDAFCVGGGSGYIDQYEVHLRKDGGASSVGDICSAKGGSAEPFTNLNGTLYEGAGGSGGGGQNTSDSYNYGENGGSDGGDGAIAYNGGNPNSGGKGQGTTTRYFGERTGTLYAGGGGGGGHEFYNGSGWTHTGGKGGAGGGGNGYFWFDTASGNVGAFSANGAANTGGGAGGVHRSPGCNSGFTNTITGYIVTPGKQISVVVGVGCGDGSTTCNGGSGICIIRWSGK